METLREQIAQKKSEINQIIAAAIKGGAKVESGSYGTWVDGVYISKIFEAEPASIIVELDAPEIEHIFDKTTEELEHEREQLYARIKELNTTIAERGQA